MVYSRGFAQCNPGGVMSYTFGPVPSRRLGRSLGVDIVPHKVCTMSCVYCEVGLTTEMTLKRREWVPTDTVVDEIRYRIGTEHGLDWITFTGSGEPTLHSGLGRMIAAVKRFSEVPMCVLTNGSLLWDKNVRSGLMEANLVIPTLVSLRDDCFRHVTRAHPGLSLPDIVEGMVTFRDEYHGELWIEIMFVAGMNDTQEDVELLKAVADRIQPDKIQLNTIVRPPAVSKSRPVSEEWLHGVNTAFGDRAEVIASFDRETHNQDIPEAEIIREYLDRRPGTAEDLSSALGIDQVDAQRLLDELHVAGFVRNREFDGRIYWESIKRNVT